MNDLRESTAILHPQSTLNGVSGVSDLAMKRHQGKAVVTFSSLETGKEQEIASDSDTPPTPSPLTISAHGMELDVPSIPTDSSVSPEPIQPSHQHTSSPTCGDITPSLPASSHMPASSHIPATPSFSSSEASSSGSYAPFKLDGRRTRLRVPASKLREILSPRTACSSTKTSPRKHGGMPGEQQCLFFFHSLSSKRFGCF